MKITAVLHFEKAPGFIDSESAELAANPSLSYQGFKQALGIVQFIETLGPYDGMFSSRLARALDTASVLAMHMDMDFQTMAKLGQAGNKEGDKIVMYPGFENFSFLGWQNDAVSVLEELELDGYNNILIVSHRPIIGALVAYAQGITSEEEIGRIVNSIGTTPVLGFHYIDGQLSEW